MAEDHDPALSVTVDSLREWTTHLLDHLEEVVDGSIVKLAHDYYWEMDPIERIDPYKEPAQFTLGQLTFDVAELDAMTDGSATTVAYGLVWLGAVLRAVGTTTAG